MECLDQRRQGEQGFALIAVLAFLMLLAIFLTPFASSARLQVLLTGNQLQSDRLKEAAAAISSYLNWRLSAEPAWKRTVDQGELKNTSCRQGGAEVFVSLIPHAKLININTANAALLADGLQQLGMNEETAVHVAGEMIVFRSPRGSSSDGADVTGGLKRAPFEDISELHDFEALHGIALSSLAQVFSVQSGRALAFAEDGSAVPSQHYTIRTNLVSRSTTGGWSAIYDAGSPGIAGRLVGVTPVDKASVSATTSMRCEELVGSTLVSVMQEAEL